MVFENEELRKIYGRFFLIWFFQRRCHNDAIRSFYQNRNMISIMRSRKLQQVGNVNRLSNQSKFKNVIMANEEIRKKTCWNEKQIEASCDKETWTKFKEPNKFESQRMQKIEIFGGGGLTRVIIPVDVRVSEVMQKVYKKQFFFLQFHRRGGSSR